MKPTRRAGLVAVLVLLALGVGMRAQQNAAPVHRPVRPTYASRGEIQILPVQGTVYMLAGAGSNVTVQVGPDAVMVVDTNEAAMSDKVLTAIRTLSPAPIRYIVNTSADPDHVGGNAALAKSAEGTVNAILAWGHARVIENLMKMKDQMIPPPVRAISDQFARTKTTVQRALMPLGREIELLQRHKAEEHDAGDFDEQLQPPARARRYAGLELLHADLRAVEGDQRRGQEDGADQEVARQLLGAGHRHVEHRAHDDLRQRRGDEQREQHEADRAQHAAHAAEQARHRRAGLT